jgi:hypothetical protein
MQALSESIPLANRAKISEESYLELEFATATILATKICYNLQNASTAMSCSKQREIYLHGNFMRFLHCRRSNGSKL